MSLFKQALKNFTEKSKDFSKDKFKTYLSSKKSKKLVTLHKIIRKQ